MLTPSEVSVLLAELSAESEGLAMLIDLRATALKMTQQFPAPKPPTSEYFLWDRQRGRAVEAFFDQNLLKKEAMRLLLNYSWGVLPDSKSDYINELPKPVPRRNWAQGLLGSSYLSVSHTGR